ncbi:hypothetical protein I7I48_00163 [Histoplasma ohiense]|nr:hypothetical protein I7I48_00163 [Histoplasma ohiense (nom. inval.)]
MCSAFETRSLAPVPEIVLYLWQIERVGAYGSRRHTCSRHTGQPAGPKHDALTWGDRLYAALGVFSLSTRANGEKWRLLILRLLTRRSDGDH